MHLREIGSDAVDGIRLAHGDAKGRFVNMVMNFRAM